MDCCSRSSLGQKQVINVCDGSFIGYVTDIEFDVCDGKISALIVGGCSSFGFGKGDTVRIPWCNVKCVGEDVILVDIALSECKCTPQDDKKKRKINKLI